MQILRYIKMSGRNLRDFIVSHRTQSQDNQEQKHLMTRMMMGLDSDRYRRVDYDEAKDVASKLKGNARMTTLRLGQLKKRARLGKERNMIKHHYPIWQESHRELRNLLREAEYSYKSTFTDLLASITSVGFEEYALDLEECDDELDTEIKRFSQSIIAPVQMLINDLKIRLHNGVKNGDVVRESLNQDGESIMGEVDSVKSQCLPINKWLAHQRMVLEGDLAKSELVNPCNLPVLPTLENAIPVEVVMANCPDEDLRNMMLRQFVDLHSNYSKRLKEEQMRFDAAECLSSKQKEEGWLFSIVYDLYHRHAPIHVQEALHSIIIDMLGRLLPDRSKNEILELETQFLKQRYSRKHCEALLSNYNRDLCNLVTSALLVFSEAQSAHREMNIIAKDRERQRKICNALHEKVTALRMKQEEVLRLEAELDERRRMRQMEEEEKRRWLEKERRYEAKKELTKYHRKKKDEEYRQELEHERRLAMLRSEIEHQRKIDKERVQYRAQKQKEKSELQTAKDKVKLENELLRQHRLDRLRQTVAISAEPSPERLVADTVSSKAKLGIGANDEVAIQKPLFNLHGYSQKDIQSDVRLRVAEALRNVGIHETEYAREVMANLPPPMQPRRDNDSSAVHYILKN